MFTTIEQVGGTERQAQAITENTAPGQLLSL